MDSLFLGLWLDNGSINSVLSYAGDTLLAAVLLDIALTGGDDLTVFCFKAESELARLVLVYLELRICL